MQNIPVKNRENLIHILQDIQSELGYISKDAIYSIGNYLDIPTSKIFGLATFYDRFRFKPVGKYHFQVCGGTTCYINSSNIRKELEKQINVKEGEISSDGLFSFETVSCMGACSHSPVLIINDKYYSDITVSKLKNIISGFRNES